MSSQATTVQESRPGIGMITLSLLTLFGIAVAHPIYDLLVRSDHATFLVAHQAESADIFLLVALSSLVLPLGLAGLIWLIRLVSPMLGWLLFLGIFFLFSLSLMVMFGKTLLPELGWAGLLACAVLAATGAVLFASYRAFRFFFCLMSPVVVIAPMLFLMHPSIQNITSQTELLDAFDMDQGNELPHIVFIIFDELPLVSLLDENRSIDRERFPNFARLSDNSTWYRNTNTIHYSTRFSIPSMLTGTDHWEHFGRANVNRPRVMLARESFPDNLFSLLENTHQQFVLMSSSNVSWSRAEQEPYIPPLEERLPYLLSDLAVIYGHQMTPKFLLLHLPEIHGQWQDFSGRRTFASDQPDFNFVGGKPHRIKQLYDAFHKSNQPVLYLAHVVLPHYPFRYNENGQLHDNKTPIRDDRAKWPNGRNRWPDEQRANQAWQAHLLQLKFVDRLLGRVLDRLESLDLYEESMVIVTADHGISFYWDSENLPQSKMFDVQAGEVALVPLFVKSPGQVRPVVSDRMVQTTDILPTLADIFGISIPWKVDGESVLEGDAHESDRFMWIMSTKTELGEKIDPEFLALKRKIELFGQGEPEKIYRLGPHSSLHNSAVADWRVRTSQAEATIYDPDKYLDMDPSGPELPAYVEGQIDGYQSPAGNGGPAVGVTVNGVIRGTSWAEVAEDGVMRFLVRVPPQAFRAGDNDVQVYAIVAAQDTAAVSLVSFPTASIEEGT